MAALLQVNLLGGFQLTYDEKPVELIHSIRLQTFIAYLVLHRTVPVVRERLAYMFWPDTSEGQARTNLRNLIHQLRQVLPFISDFVAFNNNTLEWCNESSLRLDVDEFRHRLTVEPGQQGLESAINLYKGDLLPACYSDWILPTREELREAYLSALERLAALEEERGDYPKALQTVRRLVQAEPLKPAANQRLMQLYSLADDRPAALKAYRTYARQLWQEVGVEPEAQIQELYQRLQAAEKPPQTGTVKGAAKEAAKPDETSASPLVGRTNEWRQLRAHWQNAAVGEAQIVFITGEAGIGKTRLVSELIKWAELQAIPTATAVCYPAEGSLPYGPVMSWIKAHPLPLLDKVWLAEIGRLLPEVVQKVPGLPRLEPLREAWQRQRLFEALARGLLGRNRAQIFILEDVQWCDRDTLEWLHFMLRFAAQSSLLVVVTMRHGEIPSDHPLLNFQAALHVESRYAEIELHRLTKADSIHLIEQTSQEAYQKNIDADTAASIFQHTEGNPLFLIETVRLGATLADNLLAASGRIHAILSRRLDQLSLATRETTALAATIGREFSLEILRLAGEEREEQLVAEIDELLHRRIIQEISPNTYDFTHDMLRQVALSGLSTAHRRLLHRKAAEAYTRLDQYALYPRHAEIASHFERAGLAVQAVQHYCLAAEAAADIFANAEAWSYLKRAVELADSVGVGDQKDISFEDFALILEKTGELLALDGKYPQAIPYYERALDQPLTQSGIWRSKVYRKISDAWMPQYLHDRSYAALDQAEKALGVLPPAGTLLEQQEWLQIQLDRIQMYYWDNYPDRMERLISQIEALVARVGRVGQQNALLSGRYQARMRRERYRLSGETVQIVRQRLEQAEKLDDDFNLAIAQFQYGFALLWHGDPLSAREWLRRSNDALARMGSRLPQLRCLAYLSVVSRKLHDSGRLHNELPLLLELAKAINEQNYLGIGLANQGWLSWQEGDEAQAEQLCKEAISTWQNFSGTPFHSLANWVLLAVNVARDDFSEAEAAARALMDPNPAFQPIDEPMASILNQALASCDAEERDTALGLFGEALDAARAAGEL